MGRTSIERRVARRVRRLREQRGLSQTAMARLAGTSRSQVAAVENGERSPTIGTLDAFARALRVPLVDLVAPDEPVSAALPKIDAAEQVATLLRERGPRFVTVVEKVIAALDEGSTHANRTEGRAARSRRAKS